MPAFNLRSHLTSLGVAVPKPRPPARPDDAEMSGALDAIERAVLSGAGMTGPAEDRRGDALTGMITRLAEIARRDGHADAALTGAVAMGFRDARAGTAQGPVPRGQLLGLIRAAARRLALDGVSMGRVTTAARGQVLDL